MRIHCPISQLHQDVSLECQLSFLCFSVSCSRRTRTTSTTVVQNRSSPLQVLSGSYPIVWYKSLYTYALLCTGIAFRAPRYCDLHHAGSKVHQTSKRRRRRGDFANEKLRRHELERCIEHPESGHQWYHFHCWSICRIVPR
jgi:hypothetical protein